MRISNNLILDNEGRTLILRGVNLGGDSKIPIDGDALGDHKVSFVGRPFPVEEAQDHFRRLKNAGMNFLRLIVTWEAIEHDGPGIYDEAYLAYLRKILQTAEKEGISIFIDPHQDVWSRWTGGDGAPSWTMEKLGMNLDNFDTCSAAVTKQRYNVNYSKPYAKMIWPSNYNRYATATMFSLFFAGLTYAPDLKIDGENVQDWLQNRYIAAFKHAQRRLKNLPAISGWGSMNEPHFGFIGHGDLSRSENPLIPAGPHPSPWQSICAASGYTQNIPVHGLFSGEKIVLRYETFNTQGVSLFKDGCSCPWKLAGVWQNENGAPRLLNEKHFSLYQGRAVNFADDFLKPFIVKYIDAIKQADERSLFFIEGLSHCTKEESHPSWNENDNPNAVNAFHWYDGFSLFTKSFRSWFNIDTDGHRLILGKKNIAEYFTKCLSQAINWTKKKMNNIPCLLGEFGLAFDINNKTGFKKGDYKLHEDALSMYYDAIDANLLHSTIWNYSASNTNEHGDCWNDEDLSIYSEGKERAQAGWKRPYPMATAGKLLSFNWNRKLKKFTLTFMPDTSIKAPTIIYLPAYIFCESVKVETTLKWEYNKEEQRLFVYNDDSAGEITVIVTV
ncbi:MAG: cellulase family glycosylhydrolase [Treponema sp.]|nr:cellulase family glycosylhydrolase [Treponema sp.]